MTHRWLHLRLAAPLMAFGGVTIDHVGVTREFPSASALVGLLGNALGWQRHQGAEHQALQDRLVFAALSVLPAGAAPWVITDNQNARLYEDEPGWTTFGAPERRNKGSSYSNPAVKTQIGNESGRKWITHRRRRDYLADHETRVVLRLAAGQGPSLDDLAQALDRPARPLFIGRKPCLPSGPVFQGWTQADTAHQALQSLNLAGRALWPDEGQAHPRALRLDIPDTRNWVSGLHGGTRLVWQGELA
ncbi:CRISPR-associated protein, Cas5e family [Paracoccus thiocyanatus]|uniref:CRISPR-associated protein, Cas5e family n=1 Tax=Paracoccus thiocyanatus TaxID=34006 RepID=A0A1N6QGQ0_9RHOB|nr:type I-E CRISPR-associated protein Cas5/CasD [Paracoccus thiocyanatus]SIQ15758.1 CRISPR-associated protein, Cas5e family [Paracoccus thiocyanatus]